MLPESIDCNQTFSVASKMYRQPFNVNQHLKEGQEVFVSTESGADMWSQLFSERWFSKEWNPLDGYDNGPLN